MNSQGKRSNKAITNAELKPDEFALKDKIDFLFKVLGRFDTYINATNTKASLIFAWNGVVIGTILLKINEITSLFPAFYAFLVYGIFFTIAFAAIISNIIAFNVIFPVLKPTSRVNNQNDSIVFFGTVASQSADVYLEKITELNYEKTLKDISDQVVTLAGITQSKMNKLQQSINALYTEFILIGLLFILKFIALFS